ncbi:sulfatase-like hydrolase/transferase [Fulvivirgaceae bacterium BMA12]|uniref:Sulfatase-like hydrolase/transferase n=1 Tax=Agaribacillus aureus TaxID=3051825 RepID=A0ABT8L284_9BACT|nr:sulfatase-like hydrolase/transferase [Fulvivirgaceae bacterium BMA12]
MITSTVKYLNNLWAFTFWIFLFGSYAYDACSQQKTKKNNPNVLLIYTDDHRFSGIHALGKQQVQTPHMDELANQGIAFTNTYLMGSFSGATCIPSRAMLLTGKQLFELEGRGGTIPAEHTTIGETFQQAGYHTHIIGKWHQDNRSLSRSFDTGEKIMGRGVYLTDHFRMPYWDWDKDGDFKKDQAYLLVYDKAGKIDRRALTDKDTRGPTGTEKTGPHTSEVFAGHAVDFIRKYKRKTPFFMYLAFHAPHDPRQAPKKYRDMYPPDQITLPPSYLPQHPFDNGDMTLRDEALAPWPRTPEIARKHLSDYYAIITHLDDQIGRVIAALKESGNYENTIIVLAGDSGLAVGCHGLLGKQSLYQEDGIHVPFIISGSQIRNKGESDALCYIHDIFPTICDLAKVPVPASVTGKSLLPVINKEARQIRNDTYHAYKQFQRAYRKDDYKLIEHVRAKDFNKNTGEKLAGSRVTQLFNVREDPWEINDLSFLPAYKELLNNMKEAMRQKAIELGDDKNKIGEKYDFWDFY